MAGQLAGVDKRLTGRFATLDPKSQHGPVAAREVAFGLGIVRVLREARVVDPLDRIARLQPLRQFQCVGALLTDSQRERLEPLQEQKGVEGTRAHPEVAHALNAGLNDKGHVAHTRHVAQRVPVDQAAVTGVGFGEARVSALRPVKPTTIDDNTADRSAVAADPFGAGVHDNVGTVLDGPA